MANHGEASAEVVVLAEGEEPKDLATGEKADLIGIIAEALAEALKAYDEGEGDESVLDTAPRLSGLQVKSGSPAQSTSLAAKSRGGFTVRYRDDRRATTVFTLSRAVHGGWSRLGGGCTSAPPPTAIRPYAVATAKLAPGAPSEPSREPAT